MIFLATAAEDAAGIAVTVETVFVAVGALIVAMVYFYMVVGIVKKIKNPDGGKHGPRY